MISAPIMMSVRNFTDMDFFFRVQRDREMSFAGSGSLNKILEIIFVQRAKEEAE